MTDSAINQLRMANQQISRSTFAKPSALVAWLGAVQGQDFPAAKWALGLRLPGTTETVIEQAIADRSIIRTWAMRGTLHLLAANDVHWMLALLRPRLHLLSAGYLRRYELGAATLTKSYDILVNALRDGNELVRTELKRALDAAGVPVHDLRMNLLLGRAAFDGLICCGVRRGIENTYTLLDEWVPLTKAMARDEALAELTKRYFTSHGPATLPDFVWWSGLTMAEARTGINLTKAQLIAETIDGQTYWMAQAGPVVPDAALAVYLLPSFDEYLVGYKDRRAALGALDLQQIVSAGNGIFNPVLVVDGRVVGTWKRTIKKDTVSIDTKLFYPLSEAQHEAFAQASKQYGHFKKLTTQWSLDSTQVG
ncbi:winged helix DNA-binding domain-containing protein [Spirosoma agri]|uniref:Winged helix DNA-binding domain-containing protein n=1 Tax=Spirosoma agri TaxID=1987381 RepID=A0A6M0IJS9_9BACT|nr:winged helix DNA-binding domain-containing protein [Spirosoma agri]NEU68454.1 winged helix DNA-binding domain-containing protein [Spirosoma agri]